VQTLIAENESDDLPATFWLTNPNNTWIDNVAAGSDSSGFWFEVAALVRGPSKDLHPDMEPRDLPLKLFTDNTAHSNNKGLHTYPQTGYRPPEPTAFKNHKSYKNRGDGAFFHAGGKLGIDGGYFADNKVAVYSEGDHSDFVTNSEIIGVSESYKNVLEGLGSSVNSYPYRANCRDGSPVAGIGMDSFYLGGEDAIGFRTENVTISGFGPSSCPDSYAIYADWAGYMYFWDPRTTLKGISYLDDSVKFDLCGADAEYIYDVAIRDADGSVLGTPGFIISDKNPLASLSSCTTHPEVCAASCLNTCLRTLRILIDIHTSPGIELEVSGTTDSGEQVPTHSLYSRYHKSISTHMREWSHRELFITLPSGGQYTARFVDNGATVWPRYAASAFYDAPGECGPDFDLSLDIPEATCDELVFNGNAGDSTGGDLSGWAKMHNDDIEVGSGGADGTSHSFLIPNVVGGWYGIGQYLDTRCITPGLSYSFTAKIKLTKDGSLFDCGGACPSATIQSTEDQTNQFNNVGYMVETDKEWNLMSGVFDVADFQAGAGLVLLYIKGAPVGVDLQIDQVSLVPRVISL
jgi:hypothetical protein